MAFIKLTRAYDGVALHIHFRHVVSVSSVGGATKVHTTALSSEGNGAIWTVAEDVETVVEMVEEEERRRL
jgi:hypothetical protein